MRSFTILMTILLFACANKGETGQQGEKGEQGYAGQKGDKGDPGPQGIQGLQGIQGEKGLQGSAGPKGDQGDTGLTGTQGPKGDKGDQGPIGLPGSDGTSCVGESVPEGVLVICGNQKFLVKHGDVGPKGETGSQGPQGEKGPKGDIGFEGMPGSKGEKGDTGQQGAQGLKGDQGIQGVAGQKGDKGDKGDVGPQGPAGKDLVAGCPLNSTPVVLDGVLIYCYTIYPEQFTWLQCYKNCAINKMDIASLERLILGCMTDENLFPKNGKINYWINWQKAASSQDKTGGGSINCPSCYEFPHGLPVFYPFGKSGWGGSYNDHFCKDINSSNIIYTSCEASFSGYQCDFLPHKYLDIHFPKIFQNGMLPSCICGKQP